MSNLLIVESANDKFFIEALIRHINVSNIEISDRFVYNIDNFEELGGLSSTQLSTTLKSAKSKIIKGDISSIGILIDRDDKTEAERLQLVNDSIRESFGVENALQGINSLSEIPVDEIQNVNIVTYFTNFEGRGELETVLKAIKTQVSTHADCLQSWQDCLVRNNVSRGLGLKEKDYDKFWVQMYIRYDTCLRNERNQAGTNCNNQAAMTKPIWNFDHGCLDGMKTFLRLLAAH